MNICQFSRVISEKADNIKASSIMSEMMKENVCGDETDEVDSNLRELGARPKTANTSMTMDIRSEILLKKKKNNVKLIEKEKEQFLSISLICWNAGKSF